uniref:Peptidase S1 domain-containing protein n=1 Tax=Acrobeloides nanus TaxID=290746 RepID=A0A914CGY0_9BILA
MICGATLLSSRYALTAAHCADDMETSRYFLQFGIIDIVNDNSGQVFINQIYVHPGYKTSNYTVNDIAILKLTNSVTFNSDIKPITLPVIDSNMIDGKGVVTGWGYYFRNGQIIDESSQILQKATVSFINQKACKNTWQYLNNNQLCAGDYLRGTANGDSGGPLQVLNNNTWYQVGITSTGAEAVGVSTRRRSSHRAEETRDLVRDIFPECIEVDISPKRNNGEWPPNSPDLCVEDFSLWSILENEAWNAIPQEVIDRAVYDVLKRLKKCIDAQGGHFENK